MQVSHVGYLKCLSVSLVKWAAPKREQGFSVRGHTVCSLQKKGNRTQNTREWALSPSLLHL